MRKRNLVFPLVVGSLFMPSIEALDRTNDLNSLENENNIYEAVDILIAEGGGGGGGGQKASDKKANDLKKAIKAYDFFVDKIEETIRKVDKKDEELRKRESTRIKNKIKKWEKKIIKLDPDFFGGGPNSRGPIGEGEGVNIPIGEGEGDDPRSRGLIPDLLGPIGEGEGVDTQEAEIEEPIMGGGPNSRGPIGEGEGVDIPIGGGASGMSTKDKKKISDFKEAIEYNKTDNKLGPSVPLRALRKKVLNAKKNINKMQAPKDADIFEFIDIKYASIYKLDLIESHIILLMTEIKKLSDVATNRQFDNYSPNIKEVEKQQKVLKGLDIESDKLITSYLTLTDFNLLKWGYSEELLEQMKITKGTN